MTYTPGRNLQDRRDESTIRRRYGKNINILQPADFAEGTLFVFRVKEYLEDWSDGDHGAQPVISADIAILEPQQGAEPSVCVDEDMIVKHKVLIAELRPHIGDMVFGTMITAGTMFVLSAPSVRHLPRFMRLCEAAGWSWASAYAEQE